jgi:HEAT repeat protein
MVRKAALQSLGLIGAHAAEAAYSALKDSVWYVRAHAARALGKMGAIQYAADIADLLADREWWVRQAAKEALIDFGRDSESVVFASLSHPDRFARNSAAEILQNTGGFERLLTEEISGGPDGQGRRKVLALLCKAAGLRMTNAAVERLPEPFRKPARGCIDTVWPRETTFSMANA